jgi:hypothetical protein
MPETDAGAGSATDSASSDTQTQGTDAGAPGQDNGATGTTGAHSPAPGTDDRSAEDLLADAVNRPGDADGDGKDDDPAERLKKAEADYKKLLRQSRTWEQRAKDNAGKARAHDEYVESQKTEQQKIADRAAAAEERAAKAEAKLARTMAAAAYDIPPSLIDQITGTTEDECNTSAEALAAAINERAELIAAAAVKAQAAANGGQQNGARNGGSSRPVESLRPAGMPASDNKPQDANAWIRQALTTKK